MKLANWSLEIVGEGGLLQDSRHLLVRSERLIFSSVTFRIAKHGQTAKVWRFLAVPSGPSHAFIVFFLRDTLHPSRYIDLRHQKNNSAIDYWTTWTAQVGIAPNRNKTAIKSVRTLSALGVLVTVLSDLQTIREEPRAYDNVHECST